jgi:putative transposase
MIKNHRLARHIADASFGELRRQLEYKTVWNGGRTVVADRWFPSTGTLTCSWVANAPLRRHRST